MKFSFVIPLFNRPEEINELLQSLSKIKGSNFEVIVVEDGSEIDSKSIVEKYLQTLSIKYFFKENSGPGQSRNFGADKAIGNYLIFLDSDCIVPPHYLQTVELFLENNAVDLFGGPDKAHHSFSNLQKAINYSMTSLLTTGGIRGKSESVSSFHPRSFNMGVKKYVFSKIGGFGTMRFGEDLDLSLRILNAGYNSFLIKDAFVYHKRRSNLRQFFKQIYNSGYARIHLTELHPGTLKWIHFLPTVFTLSFLACIILSFFWSFLFILPFVIYAIAICIHSGIENRSLIVSILSIPASFTQHFAYGLGFIDGFISRVVLKKDKKGAFLNRFYK